MRVVFISPALVGFVLCVSSVFAQTAAPPAADPVLLTIGGKPVTVGEFNQVYRKNLLIADTTGGTASPRQYLDLFVNYKLKVRAAEARGLDTTQAFREELATYRQQSAQSFLTDKAATEALIREAYERMKEEINASHILIALPANAAPADTLAAYNQALQLRDRLGKDENFEALARQFSKDPTAAQNGGNLGWFTALQMVYPFENAAYRTDKGRISLPVRTQFGYHLVRVNDRRSAQGKVKVAHILVRLAPNASQPEQAAAKTKIDEAYAALQRGEPFERVVKQYTDDATSRANGGTLQPFGTGQMIAPFEEAAFGLKKAGAFSAPFRTNYGWHIVKLLEKLPLEPYEQLSGVLRQRVLADGRSALSKQTTLARLKRENAFAENSAVLGEVLAAANGSLTEGKFAPDLSDALARKTLFSIGKTPVSVRDFFQFVQKKQTAQPGADPKAALRSLYDQFAEQENFRYEEAHLEEKNPEFKALVQEFHDGILLFQVMETDVLNKSLADSTGQMAWYQRNQSKYRMPESVAATVLNAASKDALDQARKLLAKQPYPLNRRLPDLYFEKGQTSLTDRHREQLFDLIVVMAKNPAYTVEITGNADTAEDDSVSAARVRNVVRYLTSGGGVRMTRIVEIDEGKFKLASKTERDKNRRVGFVFFTTSKQDVASHLNQGKPDNLLVSEGVFRKGEDKLLDSVPWKPGRQTLERGGRVIQIDIEQVDPARPKTFAEARGAVINDYQADLERQWLIDLRRQFPVQINDVELKKLK
jgi:peptidyl-prolyl cis-trans isomerase SurA